MDLLITPLVQDTVVVVLYNSLDICLCLDGLQDSYRKQGGATVLTGHAQAQPKGDSGKGKKRKLPSDAPEAAQESGDAEMEEEEDLGGKWTRDALVSKTWS